MERRAFLKALGLAPAVTALPVAVSTQGYPSSSLPKLGEVRPFLETVYDAIPDGVPATQNQAYLTRVASAYHKLDEIVYREWDGRRWVPYAKA